jgi:hypothetical protein
MIESGRTPRFAPKTFQGVRVSLCIGGKKLQCDKPAKFVVLGFVDHAHATAAQFLQDTIMRNCSPGNGMGLRHGRW